MKIEYLTQFNVAGFTYYEGLVFKKLKIGKTLKLKMEEDNKYDAKAVAVYFKNNKIGYVPRTENRIFHKLLKIGLDENIRILIQQKNSRAVPERQIFVVAHLINDD